MKTIKNISNSLKGSLTVITISLLTALAFTSCDLYREDYTEIYPEDYPKTENDLKLMVNALMYEFGSGYWNGESIFSANYGGYQVMSDMTTDVLWSGWGWEADVLYYQQWQDNSTSSISGYFYSAFAHYQFLSKARNVTRRILASEAPEEAKIHYAAEARALRGWMGLYLYDNFGPVPVATDAQLDDPLTFNYIGRLTEEQYDSVMTADLNYAINNLPETAPRGRMTKGIAMTILLKYRMIQGKFVEAEQLCRDIIALGVYGLQADYTAIFDINNHGNNEIILCVPCNSSSSWTANYMIAEVLPADMPWADNAAGWGGYVMPWDFYNTFNYADKRLACIHTEYVSTTGKYMDKSNSQQLKYGALPLKYGVDPNMSGAQAGNDLVIYRYSDILLSLAECIARNSGVNDEAEGYLNQVRRRAGLGDIMGYNTDDFLMAILTERGHEFFLEGLRRQDLIRFGKYAEYANNRIAAANAAGSAYYTVDSVHNRYPIPQTFIDESKSAIKQNPGY